MKLSMVPALHQQLYQHALLLGQVHGSLTGLRLKGQEVHLVFTEAEDLRLLGRAAVPLLTTEDAVDAKDQLLEEKRLGHVVVSADFEAEQPVGVGRLGGQKQNGHPAAGGAEPPAHLEPVQLRHHDVEDHQIELNSASEPKTLLAIVSPSNCKLWARASARCSSSSTIRMCFFIFSSHLAAGNTHPEDRS